MKSKFANGIAENIGTIAECTARIVLIDAKIGTSGDSWAVAEARVDCLNSIKKAKQNIASFLQQPGTFQND